MKHLISIIFLTLSAFSVSDALARAPHEIAGFVLGKNISEYRDKLKMDTVLPVRHAEFLKEVEIEPIPGFKSGVIVYGDCAAPGKILRIKLKYADPSKDFYQKLLEKFKSRFGKPDRWRGDPFHVVLAWKWSFTDEEGNRIGMILQHNSEDSSQKMGNAIKLQMYNLEEEELECFESKNPSESKPDMEHVHTIENPADWSGLVPR